MELLIIIPARGGSKGLPGKNIRPLLGKPLISWSIDTALEVLKKINGKVIVSTDDEQIATIAKKSGAEIPFMRPAHLAEDTSSSIDVILNVLEWYENQGIAFEYVCLLEPTSPQRDANDVEEALNYLKSIPEAESIVGMCQSESGHPAFSAKIDKSKFITPYHAESFKVYRRQEIDNVYFFEGSLYISKTKSLQHRKGFYHERTLPYVVPKWKSFEVDDLTDFVIIESLLNAKKNGLIK